MPAGPLFVPEEGVGGPDAVPAGQGEVGGGVVRGEAQSGVMPLLPGKGGESAEVLKKGLRFCCQISFEATNALKM